MFFITSFREAATTSLLVSSSMAIYGFGVNARRVSAMGLIISSKSSSVVIAILVMLDRTSLKSSVLMMILVLICFARRDLRLILGHYFGSC
jgi:hypothetical protein